jgi:hypothetical protein
VAECMIFTLLHDMSARRRFRFPGSIDTVDVVVLLGQWAFRG